MRRRCKKESPRWQREESGVRLTHNDFSLVGALLSFSIVDLLKRMKKGAWLHIYVVTRSEELPK